MKNDSGLNPNKDLSIYADKKSSKHCFNSESTKLSISLIHFNKDDKNELTSFKNDKMPIISA